MKALFHLSDTDEPGFSTREDYFGLSCQRIALPFLLPGFPLMLCDERLRLAFIAGVCLLIIVFAFAGSELFLLSLRG